MAFATERTATERPGNRTDPDRPPEYRAVEDVVRTGPRFEVVSPISRPATSLPRSRTRTADPGRGADVVLLGATGTGKSATTAWLVERLQRPPW